MNCLNDARQLFIFDWTDRSKTYPTFSRQFIPAGNYMFKVNNRNTRTRCEMCSKLTIKIPEQRQWRQWFHYLRIGDFP